VHLSDLGVGLGLLLLVEGLPLFLSPTRYRALLKAIDEVPDRVLRGLGLAAMAAGTVLLYALRGGAGPH
jgi:uncharacterized protein YjeT (DUF2065 family)